MKKRDAIGLVTVVILATAGTVSASVASATPAAAPASSSHRTPSPVTGSAGTVPPQNPSQNIPPDPDFLGSCSGTQYDDSSLCLTSVLQAITNARSTERLPPMALPSNWTSFSPEEQLFVATNLERTARGLPPLRGLATALDQAAAQAAQQNQDPSPPPGFPWSQWGSNWAAVVGNPLEAVYLWMYDDGEGSSNIDCTPSNTSGCWGHRDNILMSLACGPCVMGTGFDPSGYQGFPSWTELLVDTVGSPAMDFEWSEVAAGGAPQSSQPAVAIEPNGAPSMFVEGQDGSLINYWYVPSIGGFGEATVAAA